MASLGASSPANPILTKTDVNSNRMGMGVAAKGLDNRREGSRCRVVVEAEDDRPEGDLVLDQVRVVPVPAEDDSGDVSDGSFAMADFFLEWGVSFRDGLKTSL